MSARYNITQTKTAGFTLVEMLTVIAIIGILVSVAGVNYGPIKARSRIQNATSMMESARGTVSICVSRQATIYPAPAFGGQICNKSEIRWPTLPGAWVYGGAFTPNVNTGDFTFSATGDSVTVTCTKTSCVQS